VVLENVLNEIDDEELEVYVVWIPVLAGDSLAEAEKAALTEVADDRVTHFWDGKQNLGRAYGKALEMPNGRDLAWDIYFTYAAGQQWGETLPDPADWSHQLGFDDRYLRDGARILESLEALLEER